MSHPNRIEGVGSIKRGKALRFYFNGKQYFGYQGDTLASALLANGVTLVGRSFKYHRPRGIFSAGPEEPNALVQLESGAYTEPNTRATQVELYDGLVASSQNCWPSVGFDVGAVNTFFSRLMPAGFYYKTFMWPASLWMTYEHYIRKAAGLGRSPRQTDPDRYEQTHAHCDVLIVGAGATGLSAALAAGESGARVILIDEQPEAGGYLLTEDADIDGQPAALWIKSTLDALAKMENVRVFERTTVSGYYDYNYVTALQRVTDHLGPHHGAPHLPRQKFWKIRVGQVVLATGAIEKPLLFADNDRPGIMLASSIRTYIKRYCVLPAKTLCIFTNNDAAYLTALDAADAGADVVVVDIRKNPQGELPGKAAERGIEIYDGYAITAVRGKKKISAVSVHRISDTGKEIHGDPVRLECELVGSSGGLNPTVHLHSQAKGTLRYNDELGSFVPDAGSPNNPNISAGACNGVFGLGDCLVEGSKAGTLAAQRAGFDVATVKPAIAGNQHHDPVWHLSVIPCTHPVGQGHAKHFHDLQNDVTVGDIHLAAREGYLSVEHLKRYTTTGMGTDQGKTSNVTALSVMAEIRGLSVPDVGTTTFRPPYTPVTFGAIAGQHSGELFLQVRKTPMHKWHELNDAVFEDVGDWKRARYYPRLQSDGQLEDMHAAVQRETQQTRVSVGMVDASTLGKIDIQGKDSAEFLNWIYTNGWLKLKTGQCRYGLMLNEHGMVFDDGVTSRLGENHYHMTTTTGGAARVMSWLEEWLQTEWPTMQVYCTSVTEQWAVVALNGPKAAAVLSQLTDIDLSDEAFPHMSCQTAQVAGIEARIFRISFTGEVSFEINVPSRFGLCLWEALVDAGREFDLCVYGTETMHVLRAEKGFVIVGQDTDGTVTPYDLGMDWIVNKSKPDFLGKRSLTRSDTAAPGRKQLVGLLTDDPELVLPEGAHIVTTKSSRLPMDTEGHVTSSYMSPNVKRSICLALVKDGLHRQGDQVNVALMDGSFATARLVHPEFFPLKTGTDQTDSVADNVEKV